MPLYEYQCKKCHSLTERIQKFSDPLLTVCPHCGGELEQTITAPAVQFKGSGWYVTDYAGKSGKSGSGSNGSGSSSESDNKSDSKTETSQGESTSSSDQGNSEKSSSAKSGSDKGSSEKGNTGKNSSRKSSSNSEKPAGKK